MKVPGIRAATSVLLGALLAACATASGPNTEAALPSEVVHVVATTTVLGDIASIIAGDEMTVEVLMPRGTDPHDFQPSSQQVASINDADLVIANGLGLEEGLTDVLEAADADGVNVLEVGPLVDPIPFSEGGPDELGDDPHFWNDPLRAATAAEVVAAALSEIDPTTNWATRASAYAGELRALGAEIEAMLEPIPEGNRKLVTNHDAFGYFAHRYGFEVVGVVIPGGSTLAQPSSAELAALVEVMEEEDVRVIFAETIEPTVLADAVAAELGEDVEVVELYTDSLGPPGSGAETLIDMLRLDAERIAAALT
jgi:zinc/manganese transport system substrate-binding protein